jgi:ethanolamine utilization protein EutA
MAPQAEKPKTDEAAKAKRLSFSSASRSLIEEDQIELTSVGVDIGSSTSHLLFSTIVLERMDARYVVVERRVLRESGILLTPYSDNEEIDAAALGEFIEREYREAGLGPADIDTGALILTGVAARRRNARAIGELFSGQAGKFVSATAGDGLETLIAAHGSGAVVLSRGQGRRVLNVDLGGGTTKIALCENGKIVSMTAIDVGARLVSFDEAGRIARVEAFGRRYLAELGLPSEVGAQLDSSAREALAAHMAARVHAAAQGGEAEALEGLFRLPPLTSRGPVSQITFSGGVSEYIYDRSQERFGDLGPELARAVLNRFKQDGVEIAPARQGIRATVIGASQYTVQVSGTTIFFDPPSVLPIRNVPVIAPEMDLAGEAIDSAAIAESISHSLLRHDLSSGGQPVALSLAWAGSATFHRLQALSRGILAGLAPVLGAGHPLILVVDDDVAGILGMHVREEEALENPLVSIDAIAPEEFDFIDIGEVLRSTGAAPVVIKSLLFPNE